MLARRLVGLLLVAVVLGLAGASSLRTTSASVAADLNVETVVGDLATIWAIDFAPDGRIFLTERGGRIRTVTNGQVDPEPWMSLDVVERGESGLLGLALDPDFSQNGYVYVAYTYAVDNGLQNRLVRLKEDSANRRGSFDTVRALIRHIEAYIAEWNSHPTPFVWTKDPAAIVKKALRRGR